VELCAAAWLNKNGVGVVVVALLVVLLLVVVLFVVVALALAVADHLGCNSADQPQQHRQRNQPCEQRHSDLYGLGYEFFLILSFVWRRTWRAS
jgi:hypothetical protein